MSHSKSPVTIASWLGAPTKTKTEEEGKEEDKRENARGVWAGINRAALSMGCSNYGSLMPTVSASSKIRAADAAGTCLESIFARSKLPVPASLASTGPHGKKASGWRKLTQQNGSQKAAYFKNGMKLKRGFASAARDRKLKEGALCTQKKL